MFRQHLRCQRPAKILVVLVNQSQSVIALCLVDLVVRSLAARTVADRWRAFSSISLQQSEHLVSGLTQLCELRIRLSQLVP